MPMDQSDEDVARLFKDLHLPPEALHELAEALSLTDALTEAAAPPTLTNDVLSTFTASHFTVRGSNKVGEATQGTRPGHPYADAVFAFAFQRVFKTRCQKARRSRFTAPHSFRPATYLSPATGRGFRQAPYSCLF